MERIVENKPEVVTLREGAISNEWRDYALLFRLVYHGQIISAPQIKYRGILDYDNPMVWMDTSDELSKEQFVGESFGRINKGEAELTLKTLQEYFMKIGKQRI